MQSLSIDFKFIGKYSKYHAKNVKTDKQKRFLKSSYTSGEIRLIHTQFQTSSVMKEYSIIIQSIIIKTVRK